MLKKLNNQAYLLKIDQENCGNEKDPIQTLHDAIRAAVTTGFSKEEIQRIILDELAKAEIENLLKQKPI